MTYYKGDDALRAIGAVNNIFIDGRTLKASLGTTKYCSHFMKNQSCPKHDCMYLHELGKASISSFEDNVLQDRVPKIGDEAASFTKEEMQQGKHTDYERALHEQIERQDATNSSQPAQASTTAKTEKKESKDVPRPPPTVWPQLEG